MPPPPPEPLPSLSTPPSTTAAPASSQPPSSSPPPPPPTPFPLRPLALSLLIACPILILLPPRKLDLYTFSLSTAWAVSAGQLFGVPGVKSASLGAGSGNGGIGGARSGSGRGADEEQKQEQNSIGRDIQALLKEPLRSTPRTDTKLPITTPSSSLPGPTPTTAEDEPPLGGILAMAQKIWMGDEGPGWRERRAREDRKALEEGGYAGLIGERIVEVFGGRGSTGEEGGEEREGGGEGE